MMKKSEGIRTRAVVIIMTFSLFGCGMQKLNGFGMVRENLYAQISQDEAKLMMKDDDPEGD